MAGVELIVEALVVGAAAGAGTAAESAVTDAYSGLKARVRRLLGVGGQAEAGNVAAEDESAQDGQDLLAAVERDPHAGRAVLEQALTAAGADRDHDLLGDAARLLDMLNATGNQSGKYANMRVYDNQGVVIGDNTQVSFTFGN